MEKDRDLGGGFVCQAVRVRLMAVLMLFVRHRRGLKRLILASSCWVNCGVKVEVLGSMKIVQLLEMMKKIETLRDLRKKKGFGETIGIIIIYRDLTNIGQTNIKMRSSLKSRKIYQLSGLILEQSPPLPVAHAAVRRCAESHDRQTVAAKMSHSQQALTLISNMMKISLLKAFSFFNSMTLQGVHHSH
ncbi:hypothetical protein Pint_11896 [Pistacia integerrima]|uniref:Uncharacterized protein n=1 Tax=Pistacia integerrima TaxID=434235 RepID=A0ACC0XKE7_9ROSI|nr:hypothetical protein Pint_11896 [Pistacia integerrima]